MSNHQIILPEIVYQTLLTVAQQQGIEPAAWIASQLALATSENQPLPEFITDLIGAIDSQIEPQPSSPKTLFGEGIATKLTR
jgi:hypothetical protein